MSTIDLSDYKQLPTVQVELSDLQLNTLGVAQFLVEGVSHPLLTDLEEGDTVRVRVIGSIEGYYTGRIAERRWADLTATITLVRSHS